MSSLSEEEKIAFKQLALQYFQLDDTIKELEAQARNKKKLKAQFGEQLIKIMKSQEIEDLRTQSGYIQMHVSERKSSLNKKFINSTLCSFFSDRGIENEKALDLMKLFENRAKVEKVSLKIKKDKVPVNSMSLL